MRESLREERTLWVTDQIAQDKFPEDLEAFYLLKNPPSEEKPPAEEEGGGKKGKVSAGRSSGAYYAAGYARPACTRDLMKVVSRGICLPRVA